MKPSHALFILLLCLPSALAEDTPAQKYQALLKEFNDCARGLWEANDDEERAKVAERGAKLPPQLLQLVEENPNAPFVLDALIALANQELWLVNNTKHPGFGAASPSRKAIPIILRDHIGSEKLGDAYKRLGYGFSSECELFLRTVLEKSPHNEVSGLACLRLAQFLNARLNRLDVLAEQPDMTARYEGMFGKEYLNGLKQKDRAAAEREIETLFELAMQKYAAVAMQYGGTIGEQAALELNELRHLRVGKLAPETEGEDGKRFKLSDYRGKVVLLYFVSVPPTP